MVISNKEVRYFTDDRDGNHKYGKVRIEVTSYTRDILEKNYKIKVVDYINDSQQAYSAKTLTKSYEEIDGLRILLLSSGKDYSGFQGSELEDELLNDALLLIIKTPCINNNTECHYHSQPEDWIKFEPVAVSTTEP